MRQQVYPKLIGARKLTQKAADWQMACLDAAIATTSSNSNAVAELSAPFTNDPPTLADIELLRAKVNELITALRR